MAGIFVKHNLKFKNSRMYAEYTQNSLNSMKAISSQEDAFYHEGNIVLAAVAKVGQAIEEVFYEDHELGVYIALDGFCRISEESLSLIDEKLDPKSQREHLRGIALLIANTTQNWIEMLEGSFNIAVFERTRNRLWVANDVFGFYPLYTYQDKEHIVYASKQSTIIASTMINNLKFDYVSFAEHLLFNYIISDHSFIEGINILSNAQEVVIHNGILTQRKYYQYRELLAQTSLNKKDSFKLINESLEKACKRIMKYSAGAVNMSLTGGWDSRLILSYLIKDYKDHLRLYSFGAHDAPDITVPQQISSLEGLSYTSYLLDDQYLKNDFKKAAHDTVMISEGSRNYKRTHYLYAVRKIPKESLNLVTGIFGDEVIKVGKPQGGAVISRTIVRLLGKNFAIDSNMHDEISNICRLLANTFEADEQFIRLNLKNRIENIGKLYRSYGDSSMQHFIFRFDINLRRYFGAEAASYNDYVNCFSPFTDKFFFFDYISTFHSSHRHAFSSSNIIAKWRSTRLYASLVQKQYPPLLDYASSRGYNMRQALQFSSTLGILFKKNKSKVTIDEFNTGSTSSLFEQIIAESGIATPDRLSWEKYKENYLSLLYWTSKIKSIFEEAKFG